MWVMIYIDSYGSRERLFSKVTMFPFTPLQKIQTQNI